MPDLTLTSEETDHLVRVMRVLISPLDYPDDAQWSAAVAAGLRQSFAVENSAVVFGKDGATAMVGSFGERAMREYTVRWFETMVGDARRRAARLTSWVRADVWSFAELARGEYFHEWCVPYGNQDSAGMCVHTPDGKEVAAYINSPRRGYFPRAGAAAKMLAMLQPSLAAGVATLHGIGQYRAELHNLDAMSAAVGLFRGDGQLLHAVPALASLLRDVSDGAVLLESAKRLVRDARRALDARARQVVTPRVSVSTRRGRYVLRVSLVESPVLGVERIFVVTVRRLLSAQHRSVRERFGLTARQAEVASLLAAGHRNAEIARILGISAHTARHHTEHIMGKLGVASRAQIGTKLAGH